MPNRIIKDSINTSDDFNNLSWFEQSFFIRLITMADDFGRADARMRILHSRMFPLRDDVSENDIEVTLEKLSVAGMITRYVVNGKPFLQFNSWSKHQQIRAKKSKYPSMIEGEIMCNQKISDINGYQMISDDVTCYRNPIQSNPIQSNPIKGQDHGEKQKKTVFTPPTLEEVTAFVEERNSPVIPQDFIDFYASKGWLVGKAPMKDWKAACRRAEKWDKWENKKTCIGYDYSHKEGTSL